MPELLVCPVDEFEDNGVRIVRDAALEVGVIRRGDAYFAYRNLCPHQGGPACEGMRLPQVVDVIDAQGLFKGQRFDEGDMHIVCPWHGYEFHLATGEHVSDARVRLQRFEAFAREGAVYVRT